MKKYLNWMAFALLMFYSTMGLAQKKKFVIEGTMNQMDAPVKEVALKFMNDRLDDGEDQLIAEVVNGKYTLKGALSEPALVNLVPVFKNEKDKDKGFDELLFVFVDPGKMTIAHERHFANVKLSGSHSQTEYTLLKELQETTSAPEEEFRVNYDFSQAHKNSVVGLYALTQCVGVSRKNDSLIVHSFNQLPEKIKQGAAGQEFLTQIERGELASLEEKYRKDVVDAELALYPDLSEQEKEEKRTDIFKEKEFEIVENTYFAYVTSRAYIPYLRSVALEYFKLASDSSRIAIAYEQLPASLKEDAELTQVVKSAKLSAVGKTAQNFTQNDPEGNPFSLSSLRGKYVLIDFWASWCVPCRAENPKLLKLYNKFKNNDFEILGVSLDNKKESWINAIREDSLTWRHVSDLRSENSVANLYQVVNIPQNFLIDKDGKILARNLSGNALERKLESLLYESSDYFLQEVVEDNRMGEFAVAYKKSLLLVPKSEQDMMELARSQIESLLHIEPQKGIAMAKEKLEKYDNDFQFLTDISALIAQDKELSPAVYAYGVTLFDMIIEMQPMDVLYYIVYDLGGRCAYRSGDKEKALNYAQKSFEDALKEKAPQETLDYLASVLSKYKSNTYE